MSVRATLREMEVGDVVVFGYREASTSTVRAAACTINKGGKKRISVVQNYRELKTTATRTK
nr:MAG TPA: UPF0310 protein [Caudoviricetes sp.]